MKIGEINKKPIGNHEESIGNRQESLMIGFLGISQKFTTLEQANKNCEKVTPEPLPAATGQRWYSKTPEI